MRRDLLVERLQDAGAAYLLAPKRATDPLENLGALALPPAELKSGAQLVAPGLVPGAAAALLDGANDYIETGWATRTNEALNPYMPSDIDGWAKAGGALALTHATGPPNPAALPGGVTTAAKVVTNSGGDGITTSIAAVAGETWTYSIFVYKLSGPATLMLRAINPLNASLKAATSAASGIWTRFDVTFTATETGTHKLQVVQNTGGGENTFYVTAALPEKTATLGDYFPTPLQLASGEAGWSGTAHESASDIGPFARGTARTFVVMGKRASQVEPHGLLQGATAVTGPRLFLGGEPSQERVTWETDSSGDNENFEGSRIQVDKTFLLALTMDEASNAANLYVDGSLVGTAEETDPYNNNQGPLRVGTIGGADSFDGRLLPFAVLLRALDPSEIQALTASVPAAKVVSEPVDDRVFIKLLGPDGRPARLSGDESDASGIPIGFKSATAAPGGHVDSSCSLMRDPRRDWPDLGLVDEYIAYGRTRPLGRNIFEGEMSQFPSDLGDTASISIKALGNQVQLSDNENFKALYAKLGFEGWGDMALAHREALANLGYSQGKIPASVGSGGLSFDVPAETIPANEVSQVVLELPAGVAAATFGYRGARKGGNWANFFAPFIYGGDSETFAGQETQALTLDGTARIVAFSRARRYLGLNVFATASAVAAAGTQQSYDRLAFYGDHGLPLIPIAGTLPGLYAHHVLGHMLESAAPGLNFTIGGDGSIIPNESFVLADFALLEPTTARAGVEKLNAYFLNNWGVWDDKEFFWQPWDPSRLTWHASIAGGAKWTPAGRQAATLLNGIVVPYTDHAGVARTAGPPGSGCDYEDASLADADPNNPYTRRGRRRWGTLSVDFPLAYPTQAIQVGAVFMAESKFPQRSGTLVVRPKGRGHVPELRHPTLGRLPIWAMRAGDFAQLDDWPSPEPFRVISTEYDHDAKTLVAQLDTGAARLSAILERVGVRLTGIV